ncbi:hypothetical protein ABIC08_008932 [Bradyrhizobium sp. RT9b]|uniref:hypothetical protein n=1 Tax=unclassified Bradyrhizobium TaxID=2631580 RepID=UPI003399D359
MDFLDLLDCSASAQRRAGGGGLVHDAIERAPSIASGRRGAQATRPTAEKKNDAPVPAHGMIRSALQQCFALRSDLRARRRLFIVKAPSSQPFNTDSCDWVNLIGAPEALLNLRRGLYATKTTFRIDIALPTQTKVL